MFKSLWILAAAALLAVSTAYAGDHAGDAEHPLKGAKPGDWAKYDMVTTDPDGDASEPTTVLIEVLSNDGEKAVIRLTVTKPMMFGPEIGEREFDLSTFSPPLLLLFFSPILPSDFEFEVEKIGTIRETVEAAGKEYDCVVASYTIAGSRGGIAGTVALKEWTSPAVPVVGGVKADMAITSQGETGKLAITLTAAGDAANPPPRAVVTIDESVNNLKRMVFGIQIYRALEENSGKEYPPDLAALWGMSMRTNRPTDFFCPATVKPYRFVLGITKDAPASTVIAYSEPIETPEGPRRVVAYMGGNVTAMSEEDFQAALPKRGPPVRSETILDSLTGAVKEHFESWSNSLGIHYKE